MSQVTPRSERLSQLSAVAKRQRNGKLSPHGGDVEAQIEPGDSIECLNCGYALRGQSSLDCPECGLWLASCYRDPTPWAEACLISRFDREGAHSKRTAFWITVKSVIRFDRRTRLRTAMFPGTHDSRKFAFLCTLIAATCFGVAAAIIRLADSSRQGITTVLAIAGVSLATCIAALLIGTTAIFLFEFVFNSLWKKREHRVIPSSVHYAFAWLLPLSVSMVASLGFSLVLDIPPMVICLPIAFVGSVFWLTWLWDGISQSTGKRSVGIRLAALLAIGALATGVIGRIDFKNLTRKPKTAATTKPVNVASTFAGGNNAGRSLVSDVSLPPPQVSTHVLVIDQIINENDDDAINTLMRLCLRPTDSVVVLRGLDCQMDAIQTAFRSMIAKMTSQDRFVLFINGHGSTDGNGYIMMNDGWITSRLIEDLLTDIKTPNCLVIIDACHSAKFRQTLRHYNCIVITSTDRHDATFGIGLGPLWKNWTSGGADANRDGLISVVEALDQSESAIANRAVEIHRKWSKDHEFDEELNLIDSAADALPQIDIFGKTEPDAFAIPYRR